MLKRDILEPARYDEPPFVLSDAFPGDLLPFPERLRLDEWPAVERKRVKRTKWLRPDAFRVVQGGRAPALDELLADDVFVRYGRTRNALDRSADTTGPNGGLFTLEEITLKPASPQLDGRNHLSVYARIADGFEPTFVALFREAALAGLGADASAGMGQFEVEGELEPAGWLDAAEEPNGAIVLSTFQPGPTDPVDGCWSAFAKYGRVGPDFGLENVFKRPLVMLRPGACFERSVPRGIVGRAVPMDQLLASGDGVALRARGIEIAHLAFGVTVPARFSPSETA